MVDNIWANGAVDNILAPYEWSNGEPQAGDRLVIASGTAYAVDTDLNGASVLLTGQSGSPPPKLVVYGNSNVTAVVDVVNFATSIYNAVGTIEVVGAPELHVTVVNTRAYGATATINIDDYSQMRGALLLTAVLAAGRPSMERRPPRSTTLAAAAAPTSTPRWLASAHSRLVAAMRLSHWSFIPAWDQVRPSTTLAAN